MYSTIIIVTYNGMAWLPKCLESAKGHSIIIVDNKSNDGTIEFIKENYPQIILLPQSKNLGFGAANNIGISYALEQGAEYVFLLNQDAYLEKNTIDKLIEVHKKNPQFAIISPIHLNGTGNKLDFNFSNYLVQNKEILFDAFQNSYTKTIYEVPFVNAAAWLLPKKTLLKVGGFDPIFYHYGEDTNFCQRVLFHNLKVGVVPNVYVLHDREHRVKSKIKSLDEKLKEKEKNLKYNFANINVEIENDLSNLKKKLKKLIVKLILKLNLHKANYYIKELRLLNSIELEIRKSRELNRTMGSHYL